MSLSAELKDFTGGFKSSFDMYTRYKREKDLADYRKAKIADSQPSPGFGGEGGSTASSGATGGAKLSTAEQQQTARKIYSSLLDKGYTTNAAAGITGNLWHESGGFGGGSGDSGSAHGIAQWRGDRWTKMQEYAKSVGKDPNDLNTQVDYLDKELKTDYKSAYNLLQHSSDVKTATGIFADQYERPKGAGKGNYAGIDGMSNRLNFATQVSNFGGGAIGTSAKPIISRIKALSTSPQASLGAVPSSVAPTQTAMGTPPPETEIGEDTTSTAVGSGEKFASADEDDDSQDGSVMGAARGGLIKGYAAGGKVEADDFTNVDKGLNTNFNPVFRKSLLNLQQRATAAGIKTKLISGVRTLDDQKELYANFLAGQAGKPLPYPKRGAVKVAAKPGTSPHERGAAADLVAVDPKQQGAIDKLAAEDKNLGMVAGDPGHYQLNSGGKDTGTMVASGTVPPPPPDVPEEAEEDLAEPVAGAAQPEERDQGNSQGLADATERGRTNQAYMASEERYNQQRNMQDSAANEQALGQEAAARSTPPPPAQDQSQGAARGGLIKGYAPGGVVDATGYIAPDTATLSASTQALQPAVAAASQATPAVPTTPAPAPAAPAPAAPAAAAAPLTKDDVQKQLINTMYPNGAPPMFGRQAAHVSTPDELTAWNRLSPDQQKWASTNGLTSGPAMGSPARAMQQAGYGDWSQLDPSLGRGRPGATDPNAPFVAPSWATGAGGAGGAAAAAPAPVITGNTPGSVWDPGSKSWIAGKAYAGGGAVRGYADGGDVVDDDAGAVPTSTAPAPAPAAPTPAPAPAQPTPAGDARTRAGAPGTTDVGAPAPAPAQGKPQPPPPNLVADALHDGLMHLTKMFGLDKVGAVQDPDASARIQAFNNGAGAADGEAMHAVHRAVDPNNQMTQQELATASVAALKSYYDAKGQPEAGAKAIGEIMQHQKAVSAHFSATAAQAFQQGDVTNGMKFLKAAYDQVPDGQHIDASINADGTVAYKLTDSHSGRVIHQGTANAQQLARLAQTGASGTPYVKAVATTAARARTPKVPANAPMPVPRPADAAAPAAASAVSTDSSAPDAPLDTSWESSPYGGHSTNYGPPKPAPGPQAAADAPAGGSGAYLAQREAANEGKTAAVDTGAGPRYAAADTVKSDATVDGPKATVVTPEQKAAAAAAVAGKTPPPGGHHIVTPEVKAPEPAPDEQQPADDGTGRTVPPLNIKPTPAVPVGEKAPVEPDEPVPEVKPSAAEPVEDKFDLTPRTFDQAQPNPDDYFANYNKWKGQARTTGDRKALVAIYKQAHDAYGAAETAWNQKKSEFETEESKRLTVENEKANRAASESRRLADEAHGDAKTAATTAEARNAQRAGWRHESEEAAINRAHTDTNQNKMIEAENARSEQKLQAEIDAQKAVFAQADKKDAEIKPPSPEMQQVIDGQVKTAFPALVSKFTDPDTDQPFANLDTQNKALGSSTINGMRGLTAHLIHANGFDAETATDIVKELVNVNTDDPKDMSFDILGKDKAGNALIHVPGYAIMKIAPTSMASIVDLRQRLTPYFKARADAAAKKLAASKKPGTIDTILSNAPGSAKELTRNLNTDTGGEVPDENATPSHPLTRAKEAVSGAVETLTAKPPPVKGPVGKDQLSPEAQKAISGGAKSTDSALDNLRSWLHLGSPADANQSGP